MKLKKIISVMLTLVLTILLSVNVTDLAEVYAAEKKLSKVTSLVQKAPYSTTSITMSWKKHKDATGYEVYRSTSVKGKYTKVKATTSTSYKQGKLVRGKTYYYKVRAYKNVNGKKVYGSFSSVKAMGTKSQTPSIKVYSGVGKVKVAWNKISNISGYEVYMSSSKIGTYTRIKTVGSKTTEYLKTGLAGGKEYFFKVKSYRTVGGKRIYSSWSSIKSVKVKKAPAETVKVTGVSLNKTTLTLNKGATTTLTATVAPSNATNKSVSWSSSNTSVATVSNGKITAVGKGTATITVKTLDGGKVASCTVKVNEPDTTPTYVPVTAVSLNTSSVTLNKGGSTTLTATVAPSNATNKSVTWSSSNTSVATVSGGKITAVGKGTATITVKTVDGNKTATCAMTVNVPVIGVSLNTTSVTLNKGGNTTLTATVAPSDATNKSVTWSSSNTSVATVSNGKVTAVGKGTATITVKTTDGGKIATCTVKVNEPDTTPTYIPVTAVSLNTSSVTLNKGGSTILTATVTPSNATDKSVTWSSSNTSVATVSNGKVTAVGKGTATITVKTVDGNKTATCAVTVKVPVTGVSLNTTSVTLNKGGSTTLTATVAPSDATNKSVTWSSSNTSVATVSGGKVTAVGKGTATITVKTVDGNKTTTCAVTVNVPVTGITITNKKDLPLDFNSSTNNTYQCNISITPSDANNKSVTWTSSDSSVATVSSSGKITALKRGTATITVKTEDGGKTDSFIVYVYKSNPSIPGGGDVYLKLKLASNQNLVMDVLDGNAANGTKIQLWNANGSEAQLWQIHGYIDTNGGLAVVPKCKKDTESFILDANRGGDNFTDPLKAGCLIDLWEKDVDNAASMWEIIRLWDDSYVIKLINSNLAVGTTSATAGTQLTLKTLNLFDTNQRWFVEGVTVNSSTDAVTQKIAELRTRYIHGQYWNKYNGLDRTGTIICPCGYGTCPVDCTCTCGEFQYNGTPIAWQCHGFALKMAYEIFGENANTWGRHTNVSSIYAGDVIRINNDGHSIFVTKVDGDNIYFVDCNYTGRCQVRWDGIYTRSQLSSIVTYIAHKSGNESLGK